MIYYCSSILISDLLLLQAPQWAVDGTLPPESTPATCKKHLLPIMEHLINGYILRSVPPQAVESHHTLSCPDHLMHVRCPFYLQPTLALLESAHLAVKRLLPGTKTAVFCVPLLDIFTSLILNFCLEGDCETFCTVRTARSYCDYWRPAQTKVILLAESHAATEREYVLKGRLDHSIVPISRYNGPREFISLVYCLTYGENAAMSDPIIPDNKGTPQFWSLLAACSRGVEFTSAAVSSAKTTSKFAADILKGGGLPVKDRLNAKLEILEDLRERGIWLIDTSIFGWYISQPQVS